ncbi:MAG: AraC family transcriptional regulator [Betaproteobacteria bacterium]|nr:MAG: AraC family transcriptional regulator [Betaproteobacteria bacterium]
MVAIFFKGSSFGSWEWSTNRRGLRRRFDRFSGNMFRRFKRTDMTNVDTPPANSSGPVDEPATRLVGALTAVPGLIRELGVDPGPVLAAAGLQANALDEPSGRIPYEGFVRLLREAAARTACPHFGLLVGGAWHVADLGVTGELMRHSPTVGEGLDEFVVNHHLNSAGGAAFVVKREGFVDFGYAIYIPVEGTTAVVYDAVLAAAVNVLRDLCGEDWNPSEVLLQRPAPADLAPYRQHFRAPLRFGAEFAAIRFPERTLALAIAGAETARLEQARARVAAAGRATLVRQASRVLRTLLLHGKGSGDDVAQALSLHRRTLNRRLSAQGTTFQKVLDAVRFAVARELLRDSDISIAEIATALAYADYVSFTRAFKRWEGTSPGAWRKRSRGKAPA